MNPTETDTNTLVSAAARHAQDAARDLREALTAAGFDVDRDFPRLSGDTTASDEPNITLGRFKPAVAARLAQMARTTPTQ